MDYKTFSGYRIYSDGTIINRYGKTMSKRVKAGRYEIRLLVNGKRKNFILSRLMYWLFIEKFDMDNRNLCVVAKDGNFLNLDPHNYYLTHRKNLIQGEGHRKIAKLTDEQIKAIKEAYKAENPANSNQYNKKGVSLKDLADQYGVTKSEIAQIVKGRTRNPDNYKFK